MANDLVGAIGSTLGLGSNQPGLTRPIFGGFPGSTAPKTTTPAPQPAANPYEDLLKQYLALGGGQAQPVAPAYDIAAAQARARANAEGAVNPLYSKRLTDFLSQQEVNKQRQITDTATANKRLEDSLTNTLQTIGTNRERTAEDTQSNINQINTQSDQFQADTGQAYDQARRQQAAGLTNSGLVTSGIGAQQQAQSQASRNTAEGRQAASFNLAKQTADLVKTRTFNDLATAETQANKQTSEGKTQNQLSLSRYIEDIGYQNEQTKQQLESERLGAIAQQQPGYYSNELANFYRTLSGPTLQAAISAYGR